MVVNVVIDCKVCVYHVIIIDHTFSVVLPPKCEVYPVHVNPIDKLANICLNLFNLTCPGNYPLRHYCSIFIGSHLLRHLAPKSLDFHSDFRYQQVNSKKKPSLPVPTS